MRQFTSFVGFPGLSHPSCRDRAYRIKHEPLAKKMLRDGQYEMGIQT
jgi:hypothetical protein